MRDRAQPRQQTFGHIRKAAEQQIGSDAVEHRIAQQFKPLVVGGGKAAVRQRLSEQCARREVQEETGLDCALGPELTSTEYVDRKGRPKIVRYWVMTVIAGEFDPTEEVDEIRWLSVERATRLLSYDRDAAVLDTFVARR